MTWISGEHFFNIRHFARETNVCAFNSTQWASQEFGLTILPGDILIEVLTVLDLQVISFHCLPLDEITICLAFQCGTLEDQAMYNTMNTCLRSSLVITHVLFTAGFCAGEWSGDPESGAFSHWNIDYWGPRYFACDECVRLRVNACHGFISVLVFAGVY